MSTPAAWAVILRLPANGRTSPWEDWARWRLLKLAHGVAPREDAMWSRAITLDHLCSIACSSGSRPPLSDACVIEHQRAGRDASHQSFVGSELVIAPLYCTLWWCDGTALFLQWGLPVRTWMVQATGNSRSEG